MFKYYNLVKTAVCLLAILASYGCASKNNEVTFKSGGMTHTFSEGQGSIPQDFPLPIYPNSTTDGSVSAEGISDERSHFLMLSTKDSPAQVSKYYVDQLKAAGWKINNLQSSPTLTNLDGRWHDLEANVMISEQNGKTSISLSVDKAVDVGQGQNVETRGDQVNKVTPPTD